MKKLAGFSLLTLIIGSLLFNSCKKDTVGTSNDFPVNETFASELMTKGIPADVAQTGSEKVKWSLSVPPAK